MSHHDPQDRATTIHSPLVPLFLAHLDAMDLVEEPATMHAVGDSLVRDALRERASDIHVDPCHNGYRLRFRIDGRIVEVATVNTRSGVRLIRHFKAISSLDTTPAQRPLDARCTYTLDNRSIHLRLAVAPCINGEKLSIRLLDPAEVERGVGNLGLSVTHQSDVEGWMDHIRGMFLVTGPTGSGKTTTLYALLHHLKRSSMTIATVEDPIEYQIDSIAQMQVNGRQHFTFCEAVRGMMRLDCDVIMVGEIRESESARAAMDAAVRGRIVMSTLHCRDAVASVNALRQWGMADHEVAASLDVVIAQRLARVLCPECRRLETAADADRAWFEARGIPLPRHTWEPVGCPACNGIGYRGRTGVFEIWKLSEADRQLLIEGADELTLRRHLNSRNHRSLLDDGLEKADRGVTSLDELKVLATHYAPLTAADLAQRLLAPQPAAPKRSSRRRKAVARSA